MVFQSIYQHVLLYLSPALLFFYFLVWQYPSILMQHSFISGGGGSSCVEDDITNMTKTDFLTQQLNKKLFVGCNIFPGRVHIRLTTLPFSPASLFFLLGSKRYVTTEELRGRISVSSGRTLACHTLSSSWGQEKINT